MLISRLKRNSPLLGLVRLTARHVWLPLCPLRVALPVRLKVFNHSSNESPLEVSVVRSVPPANKRLTWPIIVKNFTEYKIKAVHRDAAMRVMTIFY